MATGEREYYDIVLIGKTGQGKSTLGNKLVEQENSKPSEILSFKIHTHPISDEKRFTQSDEVQENEDVLSVTTECKLLANGTSMIRVLDVPGFSGSADMVDKDKFSFFHAEDSKEKTGTKVSLSEANLQIIRWIVRAQMKADLKVKRIVYFLPGRGPPEKADKVLVDELKLLYHFLGKEVFDHLVVVATNPSKPKYQKKGMEFDKEDFKVVKRVLKRALHDATGQYMPCPPVVYIGLNDTPDECIEKIKDASKKDNVPLQFSENVCGRCSVQVRDNKCGKVSVSYCDNSDEVPYHESKCHPQFEQRYSTAQKIIGGGAHILALGAGLIIEKITNRETWPGFTNSDEQCTICKKFPGARGCSQVGMEIDLPMGKVKVDHKNKT